MEYPPGRNKIMSATNIYNRHPSTCLKILNVCESRIGTHGKKTQYYFCGNAFTGQEGIKRIENVREGIASVWFVVFFAVFWGCFFLLSDVPRVAYPPGDTISFRRKTLPPAPAKKVQYNMCVNE